jgi:hypothetical protein
VNKFSDNSPDGLIEGVGQELEPCGSSAEGTSPIKPKSGQWSFRFNYEEPRRLHVLVQVSFSSPFAITAELCSEMDEPQVENLRDWLTRILDAMNGKSSRQ